jgi:FkbM family methyltransferase
MRKHYLIRALRRLGLLKFLSLDQKVKINGETFTTSIIAGLNEGVLYLQPSFKSDILKLIQSHLPVQQFIDVGANYGQTLVEVFSLIPNIDYYGFEPNSTAYYLLEKLAQLNSLKVTLFPCACSDSNEMLKIYLTDSPVCSGATIVPEIRPDTYEGVEGSWISTYTLDSLISKISFHRNFILKIDVEGSEVRVLNGAEEVISKYRPIILCEVLHAHSEEVLAMNIQMKRLIKDFLDRQKYHLYQCEIEANSERLSALKSIDSFPATIYKFSPKTCDFLFIPDELNSIIDNF